MIDWHSHILPAMDDGSENTAESIELIKMLSQQGVNTVIATPHFYANDESVDSFLQRRETAKNELLSAFENCPLNIILGAEVKYYQGISHMENLEALSIQGTRLLLLEMPMCKWTEYTVKELENLSRTSGLTIILAHIERYISLQHSSVWDRLYESGFLMQVNASFFVEKAARRKALSLLKNGLVNFIGSDTHGISHRPPKIDEAFEVIEKKLGKATLERINEYGKSVLEYNKK